MKQVIEVGRGADAPSRVVIGDAINSLENYLPSGRKVVIVTDPNVHRLYKEIINRYDYCLIGLGEPTKDARDGRPSSTASCSPEEPTARRSSSASAAAS